MESKIWRSWRSVLSARVSSGGRSDWALREVGLEPDPDARANAGVGGGLHLLVDEEKVAAAARIGEERGAESEAADFSADAAAVAHRPRFGDVEGNARDDPLERGSVGLEERGEGFAGEVGAGWHAIRIESRTGVGPRVCGGGGATAARGRRSGRG